MDIAPAVLQAAAADPASPAWTVIWKESCHQGTCDPAGAALLPWLAATIAGFTDERRETPLVLAGFIALDATDADRRGNLSEIAALRTMAVARLPFASAGRESVATGLTRLFGRIDCPRCGAAFTVADHVAGISDA